MWGFHGSCSRVLMCLAGWDHMVETGWLVCSSTQIHSSLWPDRDRQLIVKSRPVRVCQSDTADMFGRLTAVQSLQLARSHPFSGESSECSTVQRPWHRDNCLTVAQYYDVKNITQELWDDALHGLGQPRKMTGPPDTDQYFKKTRAKKNGLVEGKTWAHTDLIYNIMCVQTLYDTD